MKDWTPQQRYRLLKRLTKIQLQELVTVWLADVGPTVDQAIEDEMRLGLYNYCEKAVVRWQTVFDQAKEYNAAACAELSQEASENAAKQELLKSFEVTQPKPSSAQPTIQTASQFFLALVQINFEEQVSFFQDVMRQAPRGAFWVRGGDVSARRALLYRLINPNPLAMPAPSTALRNGARIDFQDGSTNARSIWAETGANLHVKFDNTENSKQIILKQLREVLRTQDFIIVLRNADQVLQDVEIKLSIMTFWQAAVNQMATSPHHKRLLLFMLDESRVTAAPVPMNLAMVDWKQWVHTHDCCVPIQMMTDDAFPDQALRSWYTLHAPPAITEPQSYKDMWAACDNGKPQKIYEKACQLCNESPKNFDNWLRQL